MNALRVLPKRCKGVVGTLFDRSGPERINKIIDEQNHDVVGTASRNFEANPRKAHHGPCVSSHNAFRNARIARQQGPGFGLAATQTLAIIKTIPWQQPNPNELTTSST